MENKEKQEYNFKIDDNTFHNSTEDLKRIFIDEIFYQKIAEKIMKFLINYLKKLKYLRMEIAFTDAYLIIFLTMLIDI